MTNLGVVNVLRLQSLIGVLQHGFIGENLIRENVCIGA